MSRYHEVSRCRQCGRIYPRHVSSVCQGCGIQLINSNMSRTQNLQQVMARRGIKGWKVRNAIPLKKSLHNQKK